MPNSALRPEIVNVEMVAFRAPIQSVKLSNCIKAYDGDTDMNATYLSGIYITTAAEDFIL